MPDEDWLLSSVDEAMRAAQGACDAITKNMELLQQARNRYVEGAPLMDVVQGIVAQHGTEIRRASAAAILEFQGAAQRLRAGAVRSMIDTGGMSISEVARLLDVSRQMTQRIYKQGTSE